MSDLLFQNISSVQSNLQPAPVTLTAAATLAPSTYVTFITGTTALVTLTPPVTGQHSLVLISKITNWAGATTAGNIIVASITNGTTWLNRPNLFVYDPASAKYYPQYAVLTTTAP